MISYEIIGICEIRVWKIIYSYLYVNCVIYNYVEMMINYVFLM